MVALTLISCGMKQSTSSRQGTPIMPGATWETLSLSDAGVSLSVQTTWDWSAAHGAWVIHPTPPEDDFFFLILRGESGDDLVARRDALFPMKKRAAPPPLKLSLPESKEGQGALEGVGEVYYIAQSISTKHMNVLVTAFLTLRERSSQALTARAGLIKRALNSLKVK